MLENKDLKKISVFKIILHIVLLLIIGLIVTGEINRFIFVNILSGFLENVSIFQRRTVFVFTHILTAFFLFYLYNRITKKDFKYFRIVPFNIPIFYILCSVLLPIFIAVCFLSIGGNFSINGKEIKNLWDIIVFTPFICMKAGIIEETVFRGYVMKIFEEKWGKISAVIFPSLIFSLIHIFNLENFNIISVILLIIAGTLVGVMFSLITYVTGNIWSGALVHTLWNAVLMSEILSISTENSTNTLFFIQIPMKNVFITGGSFGIESSVFAIAGYGAVIVFSLWLVKRKKADLF